MNPAREALTRAVNRAIAEGARRFVNIPPVALARTKRERKAARKLMQRPFWMAGADRAAYFDHLDAAAGARRFYAAPSAWRRYRALDRHAAQIAAARELRLQASAAGYHLPGSESVNLLHAMRARGLR